MALPTLVANPAVAGTSLTAVYPYTITGGSASAYALDIGWYRVAGSTTVSGIVDSLGNTWTIQQAALVYSGDSGLHCARYICERPTGGTGTVTFTFAAAIDGFGGYITEQLGCITSGAITDQAPVGNEDLTGPFASTTTGATSQADEVVIACTHTYTSAGSTQVNNWSANGYTALGIHANTAVWTDGIAYKILTATGAQTSSLAVTGATADAGLTFITTFKLATTGPTVTGQPSDTQVASGATASFTVSATASGGGSLSYQWQLNGTNVSTGTGGTTASYTTAALGYADDLGSYTCIVTETGGTNDGTTTTAAALVYVGIRIVGANTPVYSATSGATTLAPSYSTLPPIQAGDEILLIVDQKPSTANSGTLTTPSGYDAPMASQLAAGGYGATLGSNTGNTNKRVLRKTSVTGSETGAFTVTLATNNVASATLVLLRPPPGQTIAFTSAVGSQTAAGNVNVTLGSDPGFIAGDVALSLFNGSSAVPTYSAEGITSTGVTYSAVTELAEPSTATGNDVAGFIAAAKALSGTSSAAPVITATVTGTNTNVRGPAIVVGVRAAGAAPSNPLVPRRQVMRDEPLSEERLQRRLAPPPAVAIAASPVPPFRRKAMLEELPEERLQRRLFQVPPPLNNPIGLLWDAFSEPLPEELLERRRVFVPLTQSTIAAGYAGSMGIGAAGMPGLTFQPSAAASLGAGWVATFSAAISPATAASLGASLPAASAAAIAVGVGSCLGLAMPTAAAAGLSPGVPSSLGLALPSAASGSVAAGRPSALGLALCGGGAVCVAPSVPASLGQATAAELGAGIVSGVPTSLGLGLVGANGAAVNGTFVSGTPSSLGIALFSGSGYGIAAGSPASIGQGLGAGAAALFALSSPASIAVALPGASVAIIRPSSVAALGVGLPGASAGAVVPAAAGSLGLAWVAALGAGINSSATPGYGASYGLGLLAGSGYGIAVGAPAALGQGLGGVAAVAFAPGGAAALGSSAARGGAAAVESGSPQTISLALAFAGGVAIVPGFALASVSALGYALVSGRGLALSPQDLLGLKYPRVGMRSSSGGRARISGH